MQNLFYGIITVVVCLVGYWFAWRCYNRKYINIALFFIVLCGLLLRLYTASDFFLHPWDERYHALVAKNLINHPFTPTLYENPVLPYDFKNWTANHIWIHKQPFPLWGMALSMSAFGVNEFALRLPSIVLTTIGIAIVFYIGRYLFSSRVGIIAAFLFSIHGLIIELTAGRVATDHMDVFFLFFILLAVLLAIKYFQTRNALLNLLCGVSIGIAILCKWLPALIVLPIWLLLALDATKQITKKVFLNFIILCTVTILVALPWQLYIFHNFPAEASWENSYNYKHMTESLEGHGQPFYYHFDKLRMLYGEMVYLPLLWFFYKSLRTPKNYKRLSLTIWILVPFVFFSIAATKMQAYTLLTAPAIFIVTALFWEHLYRYRKRFRFKWLAIVTMILLLALPVRFSIERIKPFEVRDRNPLWAQELKALKHELNGLESVVIFNAVYPIETMFYTNCTAYSEVPDSLTITEIEKAGYNVFIRETTEIEKISFSIGSDDLSLPEYNVVYRRN